MEDMTDQLRALSAADLFGGLRQLANGDTVQRGDIFIDDGQRHEMNRAGIVLGVQCLGRIIRKDNGGWYRPSPNAMAQTPPESTPAHTKP